MEFIKTFKEARAFGMETKKETPKPPKNIGKKPTTTPKGQDKTGKEKDKPKGDAKTAPKGKGRCLN